ncbi:MAG: hypothetical protein RBS38_15165 [Bacteroidales bacterium]|jgi:hypothetical protein|nr:hypothetical protein [Bacteroidales bacterium]
MKPTKIYVLVAHAEDGRIYDLGFAEDIKLVRKEIGSESTKEQLKEFGIKEVSKYEIRDNYFPTKYYSLKG